jgi:hypothetical protein
MAQDRAARREVVLQVAALQQRMAQHREVHPRVAARGAARRVEAQQRMIREVAAHLRPVAPQRTPPQGAAPRRAVALWPAPERIAVVAPGAFVRQPIVRRAQ